MAELHVDVVAADRKVWSGAARQVSVRTTDGDVGILPDHTPMLAVLIQGEVNVVTASGDVLSAATDGGFLSVEHNHVSIVAGELEITSDAAHLVTA